jgi:uncharacterized repeat protein (TIGR03803 family)
MPARHPLILPTIKTPRTIALLIAFCIIITAAMQAQTYTVIASFDSTNGRLPQTSLVQGVDGNFYGTTMIGAGYGNVFRVTPSGQLTSIYDFCSLPNCSDGWQPNAALALGPNGNFYGTTTVGGGNLGACEGPACGTVFEITPSGQLTTLHSFCSLPNCVDGAVPQAGLVLGSDGNFYGTTSSGGKYNSRGTVFRISPTGTFKSLYSFCSKANCADGADPSTALIEGRNGNFYGTTYDGGAINCPFFDDTFGCGTIFEITPSGTLTTLFNFGTVAGLLQSPVIQAANGNLYGTSPDGGAGLCNYGCGTVFELTPTGKFTRLYSFCTQEDCPDGAYPFAALIQATDGQLYGSTSTAGTGGSGTLFSISPEGSFDTLYSFQFSNDGLEPEGAMFQATDGSFFGVTNGGGAENQGVVFQLSTGLGPFVATVPTSGKIGAQIIILGNNLTGATEVSFNGTPAAFTVVSSTEITAAVPSGATSGSIVVGTADGNLTSNVEFRIIP